MNVKLSGSGVLAVAGVVAGVALLAWLATKGKAAAAAVGTALNPTDPGNLAYRGTNAIGSALSGDGNFTFGGWIFDATHDELGNLDFFGADPQPVYTSKGPATRGTVNRTPSTAGTTYSGFADAGSTLSDWLFGGL